MSQKLRKSLFYLKFSIIIIFCVFIIQLSEGFRFRLSESENDDGEGGKLLRRRTDFRDVPFKKIAKIYHASDFDDDDDDEDGIGVYQEKDSDEEDDDDDIDEDDDEDDEEEKRKMEKKYVFEKINRAKFDDLLTKVKKRTIVKDDDDDDDERTSNDDDDDDDDNEKNQKKSGLFSWLKSKRDSETDDNDDGDDEEEVIDSGGSWFSNLKQKVSATFSMSDTNEDDTDDNERDDDESTGTGVGWFTNLKQKISEIKFTKDDKEDDGPSIKEEKQKSKSKPIPASPPPQPQKPPVASKPLSESITQTTDKIFSFIKEKSDTIVNLISKDADVDNKEHKSPVKKSPPTSAEQKSTKGSQSSREKISSKSQEQTPSPPPPVKKESKKSEGEKSKSEPVEPEPIKEETPAGTTAAELESLEDFDDMLLSLPSFVPNYANVHNERCKQMGLLFTKQVRGQKHWALQMMDASAKIPAGLMLGNVNQLGDFDLCTNIATKIKLDDDKTVKMRGKYCLAQVDLKARTEELKLPVHLMQGRSFLRSTLKDPSHFIPRFTTFNWGICLPSACTHEDAEQIITDGVKNLNASGIRITVDVPEGNCYVKHRTDYAQLLKDHWQITGTIAYFIFVTALVVLSSLNDYWLDWKENIRKQRIPNEAIENIQPNEAKSPNESLTNQILMAFSIKRTMKMLVDYKKENNESIECLHGLKAFSTFALYIALKLIPLSRVPFTNRIFFTEYFNSSFSVLIRTAFLYTDVFLLISGILASYKMSKDILRTGKIPWLRRFAGRVIRLVPILMAVLLFYAWIWEHIGSGPQWGDVVQQNADICKRNLWQNLLHIQNWYSFDEICATHTHQLGIEMQFYLLSPLIVWLLHSMPVIGLGAFGILHGISAAMRYSSTITNRLSPVVFHGMKLSQFYRTADLSFVAPLHRATPYFTGIGVGYILSQIGRDVRLPKGVVLAGWISSMWGIVWCFWSPSNLALKNYQYDPVEVASYSAWASLVWSLAISWIIFACFTGHGITMNHLLGSKPMIILSKISYAFYLIEFLVFFYRTGTIRGTQRFNLTSSLFDWSEISFILIAAFILTLTFDLPFQKIKMILTTSSSSRSVNFNEPEQTKDHTSTDNTVTSIENSHSMKSKHGVEEESEAASKFENIFENQEDDVFAYKFKQNDTMADRDRENTSSIWEEKKWKPVRKVWDDEDEGGFFGNDDDEEEEEEEENAGEIVQGKLLLK